MKKFLVALSLCVAFVAGSFDADAAARFGGGSSFGRSAPSMFQRATPAKAPALQQRQQAQPQQAARPQQGQAAPAKSASPWRGALMGAAAALGIAGLMSALGLSESFTQALMMILMAVVAWFVIRTLMGLFLAKKMAPATVAAKARINTFENQNNTNYQAQPASSYNTAGAGTGSVMDQFFGSDAADASRLVTPPDFDAAQFEAVSKENFSKLQKAWDTGNVLEISDFTTNELFTSVTHQLRERGSLEQKSEVIDLSAKFLGMVEEGNEYVAVVRFDGAMKVNGEFEEVHESWILTQPTNGKEGWLLAGIEQVEQ